MLSSTIKKRLTVLLKFLDFCSFFKLYIFVCQFLMLRYQYVFFLLLKTYFSKVYILAFAAEG